MASRQRTKVLKSPPCPRCGGPADRLIDRRAVSLKDGATAICGTCGQAEKRRQSAGDDPWPGFPNRVRP